MTFMIEVKEGVESAVLLHAYDPTLVKIYLFIRSKVNAVITEGWRSPRHDEDVHSTDPCRGMDLRSWIYHNPQFICDEVNKRWVYDPEQPEKKCAIYHDSGNGKHIHLQSHPNTVQVR